jgi:hypothetical protein
MTTVLNPASSCFISVLYNTHITIIKKEKGIWLPLVVIPIAPSSKPWDAKGWTHALLAEKLQCLENHSTSHTPLLAKILCTNQTYEQPSTYIWEDSMGLSLFRE